MFSCETKGIKVDEDPYENEKEPLLRSTFFQSQCNRQVKKPEYYGFTCAPLIAASARSPNLIPPHVRKSTPVLRLYDDHRLDESLQRNDDLNSEVYFQEKSNTGNCEHKFECNTKHYYIASRSNDLKTSSVPKITLKTLNTPVTMPTRKSIDSHSNQNVRGFAKVRKKLERQLQVKLNRKTWNLDKFSLIKARRNGGSKPEGLYRLSKPRKRKKQDEDKIPTNKSTNHRQSVPFKPPYYLRLNLKEVTDDLGKISDLKLKEIFPSHFPKFVRIVLSRIDGDSKIPDPDLNVTNSLKCIQAPGEEAAKIIGSPDIIVTKEHINKLKMKLQALHAFKKINYECEPLDCKGTMKDEKMLDCIETKMPPPPLDMKCPFVESLKGCEGETRSPLPPILEPENREEPYVYYDRDECESVSQNSRQEESSFEHNVESTKLVDTAKCLPLATDNPYDPEECIGNCTTLQVYVYEDRIDPTNVPAETVPFEPDDLENVKQEALSNDVVTGEGIQIPKNEDAELPLPYPSSQALPVKNCEARLRRDSKERLNYRLHDGYDSDATVAYSEDEDEEELARKSCVAEKRAMTESHSLECNALKIKRTDQLFQFKGRILDRISSNVQTKAPLNNIPETVANIEESVFKIPSKTYSRTRKGSQNSEKEICLSQDSKVPLKDPSPYTEGKNAAKQKSKKKSNAKEESLTLTIFRKAKTRNGAPKTKTKPVPENTDFGSTISEPDRRLTRKKQIMKVKTPVKTKETNDLISNIEKVFRLKRRRTKRKDEDELPKILPPKRRRMIKEQARSVPIKSGMERLMQEFPRHNWLENKYLPEESSGTMDSVMETGQQYVYEHSFTEENGNALQRRIATESCSVTDNNISSPQDASQLSETCVSDVNGTCHSEQPDGFNGIGCPSLPLATNIGVEETTAMKSKETLNVEGTETNIGQVSPSYSMKMPTLTQAVTDDPPTIGDKAESSEEQSRAHSTVTKTDDSCRESVDEDLDIRSVSHESDVGAVISICESNQLNAHKAPTKQKDSLPPLPKLIHATTLEAINTSCTVSEHERTSDTVHQRKTSPKVHEAHFRDDVTAESETTQVKDNASVTEASNEISYRESGNETSIQMHSSGLRHNGVNFDESFSLPRQKIDDMQDQRIAYSVTSNQESHADLNVQQCSSISSASIASQTNSQSMATKVRNFQEHNIATSTGIPANQYASLGGTDQQRRSSFEVRPRVRNAPPQFVRDTGLYSSAPRRIIPGTPQNIVQLAENPKTAQLRLTNEKQFQEALRYEKLLQEYKTIEKMVELKEQERDHLSVLGKKKLKELNFLKNNSSHQSTNANTLEQKRSDMKRDMSSVPPPAHQPKKENVLELLDKMDSSHQSIPQYVKNTCPFRIRDYPVHDSPHDITLGPKDGTLIPTYFPASRPSTQKGQFPANQTETMSSSRSSSAPVSLVAAKERYSNSSVQSMQNYQLTQTQIYPQQYTNTSNLETRGNKRANSEDTIALSSLPVSLDQHVAHEKKIQEELHAAVAMKKQRMDVVQANKNDNSNVSNSSVSSYKPIAPNCYPVMTEQIRNSIHGHWKRAEIDTNLTKELLRKQNAAILSPGREGQYNVQLTNIPHAAVNDVTIGNQMNRTYGLGTVPQRNVRPQTVRLLGAVAMPQSRPSVPNVTQSCFPAQSMQQQLPNAGIPNRQEPQGTEMRNNTIGSHGYVGTSNVTVYNGAQPVTKYQQGRLPQQTAAYPQASNMQQGGQNLHGHTSQQPLTIGHTPTLKPRQPIPRQHRPDHMSTNTTITGSNNGLHTQVTRMNGNCVICNKFALYLCSSCQNFWYCSPQCQLKHWVTHQNDCGMGSA